MAARSEKILNSLSQAACQTYVLDFSENRAGDSCSKPYTGAHGRGWGDKCRKPETLSMAALGVGADNQSDWFDRLYVRPKEALAVCFTND
jgi:hypothetical protein